MMQVKERPILFSAPMINAIREGRKTQTRRVVKPQPSMPWRAWDGATHHWQNGDDLLHCPYGQSGDRLWVRETFRVETFPSSGSAPLTHYRADDTAEHRAWSAAHMWRPSIFMPRWASRITLEVVGVRVERVQDITAEDAKAEGADQEFRMVAASPSGCADYHIPLSYRGGFANLWDQINEKRIGCSWDVNPWCWVVEFRPC